MELPTFTTYVTRSHAPRGQMLVISHVTKAFWGVIWVLIFKIFLCHSWIPYFTVKWNKCWSFSHVTKAFWGVIWDYGFWFSKFSQVTTYEIHIFRRHKFAEKLAKNYGFIGFSSSKLLILLIIFVTISSENLVSSGIVFLGFFLTALWSTVYAIAVTGWLRHRISRPAV